MRAEKIVRIACASGFWGDSMVAVPQLLRADIDYLVFDYLAETTMAILAAARRKHPDMGYATDFVETAMRPNLARIKARGVRVISNAGGIHPRACAAALQSAAETQGIALRIAVVDGDDLSGQMPDIVSCGTRDMSSGAPLPASGVLSASAYLGAAPIAAALTAGADVVITGRCVDSAVTLGALVHEFGWAWDDYDRLASGSLAGHIIECGCQATGGLHTDWQDVPDWAHIGYPIVECAADGSFVVTKPAGTGGCVRRAAVAEQLLYEIGDPGAYLLPDVCCDFRAVAITQQGSEGDERVHVAPAQGRAPTPHYKVSSTRLDGFRCAGSTFIIGRDAARKARRTGEAVLERVGEILQSLGLGPFSSTRIEVFGAEELYGPHARTPDVREAMLRIVANHPERRALEIFAREIAPSGTSWSPGTTGPGSGRPRPSARIVPFAFLWPKDRVDAGFWLDGVRHPVAVAKHPQTDAQQPPPPLPPAWERAEQDSDVHLPLHALAWARSGDKGNLSNIGVVARRAEWLPLIWQQLTPQAVGTHLAHLVRGKVERFYLPGSAAMNLLLHEALDGGGPASMRIDPLGKGMAQMLLDMPLRVPQDVAACAHVIPASKAI